MAIITISGAVLAGGRSTRMGSDKARIRVDGEALLARQLRLLAEAGIGDRMVIGRPDDIQIQNAGVRFIPDSRPNAGPLAGLEAALQSAEGDLVMVLAVDLPFLTTWFLRRLSSGAGPQVGLVPWNRESAEPLVAVYPKCALKEVSRRLDEGQLALQPLVRAGITAGWLKPLPVAREDAGLFTNWNCPEDIPHV